MGVLSPVYERGMQMKNTELMANGQAVRMMKVNGADFICLTDIARFKNPEFPADVVRNWMRSKMNIIYASEMRPRRSRRVARRAERGVLRSKIARGRAEFTKSDETPRFYRLKAVEAE